MSFDSVAIVYIKGSAYRIHLWYMSKDDAINIIDGSSLIDERSVLYIYIFLLRIKMRECVDFTYYQRNRDVILNRARDYYENDKERLREQAKDKYINFSEKEKK